MEITIGTSFMGSDTMLGTVRAMVAKPDGGSVDGLLISESGNDGSERLMPLALVTLLGEKRDNAVHLNMDGAGFLGLDIYPRPEYGPYRVLRTDERLPVIARGTAVADRLGERVGQIQEFSTESDSGRAARITLRAGLAFLLDRDLPACWVRQLSARGVILNVSLREIIARLLGRWHLASFEGGPQRPTTL